MIDISRLKVGDKLYRWEDDVSFEIVSFYPGSLIAKCSYQMGDAEIKGPVSPIILSRLHRRKLRKSNASRID